MQVTAAKLYALAPGAQTAIAQSIAATLSATAGAFEVNSARRMAHFLAQTAHESGGFIHMEENLRYRDPARLDAMFSAVRGIDDAKALIAKGPAAIANRAYAGRNGNGDEAGGDGWRYRGRGLIQLTGKANYAAAGKTIGLDLVKDPDLLLQADPATRAALAFWKSNGCNEAADTDSVLAVTRIINGKAMEGLEHRKVLTEKARKLFA
jgi:putative chitinase